MHYVRLLRSTSVAALVVLMLLLASCGMQPNRSTSAPVRLSFAPGGQVSPLGGVVIAPELKLAPQPMLAPEQPLLADRVGEKRVTHELKPAQSVSQAQTQTHAQTHSQVGHHGCFGD